MKQRRKLANEKMHAAAADFDGVWLDASHPFGVILLILLQLVLLCLRLDDQLHTESINHDESGAI